MLRALTPFRTGKKLLDINLGVFVQSRKGLRMALMPLGVSNFIMISRFSCGQSVNFYDKVSIFIADKKNFVQVSGVFDAQYSGQSRTKAVVAQGQVGRESSGGRENSDDVPELVRPQHRGVFGA